MQVHLDKEVELLSEKEEKVSLLSKVISSVGLSPEMSSSGSDVPHSSLLKIRHDLLHEILLTKSKESHVVYSKSEPSVDLWNRSLNTVTANTTMSCGSLFSLSALTSVPPSGSAVSQHAERNLDQAEVEDSQGYKESSLHSLSHKSAMPDNVQLEGDISTKKNVKSIIWRKVLSSLGLYSDSSCESISMSADASSAAQNSSHEAAVHKDMSPTNVETSAKKSKIWRRRVQSSLGLADNSSSTQMSEVKISECSGSRSSLASTNRSVSSEDRGFAPSEFLPHKTDNPSQEKLTDKSSVKKSQESLSNKMNSSLLSVSDQSSSCVNESAKETKSPSPCSTRVTPGTSCEGTTLSGPPSERKPVTNMWRKIASSLGLSSGMRLPSVSVPGHVPNTSQSHVSHDDIMLKEITSSQSTTSRVSIPHKPSSLIEVENIASVSQQTVSTSHQKIMLGKVPLEKEDGSLEKEDGPLEKEDGPLEKENGSSRWNKIMTSLGASEPSAVLIDKEEEKTFSAAAMAKNSQEATSHDCAIYTRMSSPSSEEMGCSIHLTESRQVSSKTMDSLTTLHLSKSSTVISNETSDSPELKLLDREPDPTKPSKRKLSLPWWSVFFAWFLVVAVSLTCGFFTILYSFNYGLKLSMQWAKSLVFSWFSDMLVEQPLKVLGLAVFFSLLKRKPDNVDHIDVDEYLEETKGNLSTTSLGIQAWLRQDASYQPPTQDFVLSSKKYKALEKRMWDLVGEMIRYVIFMYLVLLIAYSQLDPNIFWQNKALSDALINVEPFEEIEDINSLWQWGNTTLLDATYDAYSPNFMTDLPAYRLGSPRLRQLRIKKDRSCRSVDEFVGYKCQWRYSSQTEDRTNYNSSWNQDWSLNVTETQSVWFYQDPENCGGRRIRGEVGAMYSGGGYVAELGRTRAEAEKTLGYLMQTNWIDSNTVAVIVEMSIYNANVNLLSLITILFEMPHYGGLLKHTEFISLKMYRSTQGFHYFVLAFEIVYCLYTLYFAYFELRRMSTIKKQYFQNPWNFLEVLAIISSVCVIGLYIGQALEVEKVVKMFAHSGSKQAFLHKVLTLGLAFKQVFGLLVCIGMIKFLHLLRFNPLINKFGHVLSKASAPLAWCMVLLIVCFMFFGSFMHVVAGHQIAMFRSITVAITSLFLALLGDFDIEDFEELHPILGPLIFLLYVFTITIMLFNVILIVFVHALDQVNQCPSKTEDAELLWMFVHKIQQWLGLRNLPKPKDPDPNSKTI